MEDAQSPYEHEADIIGEDLNGINSETESNGQTNKKTSPNIAETMRSLTVELQSCRADNEMLIKSKEEQNQLKASMLQSLIDIQRQMHYGQNSNNHASRTRDSSRSHTRKGSHSTKRRTSGDDTSTPSAFLNSESSTSGDSLSSSRSSYHR